MKFSIQMILLLSIWLYFHFANQDIFVQNTIFLFPILVLSMALLGLGIGLIISSLTTKYRDLSFLVTFGVQLLMYLSPIVYPLSIIPKDYKLFFLINPMTSIIETFKHGFIGPGSFSITWLLYSILTSILLFYLGIRIFTKLKNHL